MVKIASLLAAAAGIASAAASCPIVKPVENLNFTEYTRKTWYIQQQQVTPYMPLTNNFCVLATYGDEVEKVPFFDGKVIAVHNYANEGKVDGGVYNYHNGTLCARQPKSDSSGLLVAPCFLPNELAGDYWVVAMGEDPVTGEYDWVAVSGGTPTVEYPDGCTTKTDNINESGLWIFTRTQMGDPKFIAAAQGALTKLGYTLTQLHTVTQEGCHYINATLK